MWQFARKNHVIFSSTLHTNWKLREKNNTERAPIEKRTHRSIEMARKKRARESSKNKKNKNKMKITKKKTYKYIYI